MVPEKGLEPPRCYPPDFESGASANSATPACLWKTLLKTKPIISYNLISSSFFIVFAPAFLQAKKKYKTEYFGFVFSLLIVLSLILLTS